MTVLAVIPARGGSKQIPRKNLMPINGQPLIDWTICAAYTSFEGDKPLDRIVVSSDSEEILAVASGWPKVIALKRPSELATDEASTDAVLIHAATELGVKGHGDYIVCLQPTSPLRSPATIAKAIEQIKRTGSDSCLTLCRGPIFTWSRLGYDDARDMLRPVNCTLPYRVRRQDMAPSNTVWVETGSVYVTRAQTLLKYKQRLTGAVTCIEVPREESIEIDTPYDAWLVEQRMKYLEEQG